MTRNASVRVSSSSAPISEHPIVIKMSSRTLRARVASAVSEVIGEAESGILVLLDLLEKDLGRRRRIGDLKAKPIITIAHCSVGLAMAQ